MKRYIIATLVALSCLFVSPPQADAGPLCRIARGAVRGVGCVLGVRRRQARRAARRGHG